MKQIELINISNCCGTKPQYLESKPPQTDQNLPTAIIGAGPVGLAAAAHLADREEPFILIESGARVGTNILQWGHVRLFSPWQYNLDKIAMQLLEKSGWVAPDSEQLPLGKEIVEDYLEPLANLPEIYPNILFNTTVTAVSKKGLDKMKNYNRSDAPFVLYLEQKGKTRRMEVKAVIDATGTWSHPNPVNADSCWTKEEKELNKHIYYGIPDLTSAESERYMGKRVAVVGGGHSAINTILELSQLGQQVEIYWIMRKKNVEDAYGGQEKDALQARGELGSRIHHLVDTGKVKAITPFHIHELKHSDSGIEIIGEQNGEGFSLTGVGEIIANTGSRPDFSFLREIRLSVDSATESVAALSPLIDPNLHSCGTVRPHGEETLRQPEKNFYIVGMKSYGRAPTFLMATGYEQVRSIVAYLTGDFESAQRVELELPETGVCSTNLTSQNGGACCGSSC
ncbi:NAD(P)-binding domain-containing protein [Psychrobacillus sp. FSL H8-0483]|uniref:NAD(P)-binding domain-containing protein n=1 Tax=Psychrobacillus sp. FSL H8-0483 TaxID=2921389 RepID=UPI00315A884F